MIGSNSPNTRSMNPRSVAEMFETSPSPWTHHTSRPLGFRPSITRVWDLNNSLIYQNFQPLLLDFQSDCWRSEINWACFALSRLAAKRARFSRWQRFLNGRPPPGSTISEIAESASKPTVENRIDVGSSGRSRDCERLCPGGQRDQFMH